MGNPDRFDEHKVFLRYESAKDAESAYKAGHHAAASVLWGLTAMSVDEFKSWIQGDLSKPCGLRRGVKP